MALRIDLFGGFRVTADGRVVAPRAWSQCKPAALVKLLALAPGHQLLREQAIDALWPQLDPQAAAANLREALHSARRSLGAGAGAELILSAGDLLCLPPDGLTVDVDDYWSLVRAPAGQGTRAMTDEAEPHLEIGRPGGRQRFLGAAALYEKAGHSFWADWASAQKSAVDQPRERSGNAACVTSVMTARPDAEGRRPLN